MAKLNEIKQLLAIKELDYEILDDDGSGGENGVKTLIVRVTGGFIALCLRLEDRVDFRKVSKNFGNKSELASADEVLKVTGVPAGAVCPILLEIPIYLDRSVLELEGVEMGSGALGKSLRMELKDLLVIIKYEVKDLALTQGQKIG